LSAPATILGISYPAVRGEFGILDYSYPPGHAWRYGVLPDGVDHEFDGRMRIFLHNCCLPSVTGYLPRGYYKFGFSTDNTLYNCRVVSDGAEFGNIIHQIARVNDWVTPAATVTMSGGAISGNPTVTVSGTRCYPAPEVVVESIGGANALTGAHVHCVMEASSITYISGPGSGQQVNDVLTLPNGVQVTVNTVDANGGITAATITTRGTTTDPTTGTGIWGNRYEQQSTTGSGTGAHFIIDFRVNSMVTDAAGSGGAATGNVLFRPSQLIGCRFEGTWYTYGRHGVQDTRDNYMERVYLLHDATKNTDGTGNPGGHWDDNDNFKCDEIVVVNTQQVAGSNNGGAALSIDTSSVFQNRRCKVGLIHVQDAAWHGLALNADLSCDRIRVDNAGRDASRIASNEFGSNAVNMGAKAFYWWRGNLWCPDVHINCKEEKVGAGFEYNFLCASTGIPFPNPILVAGDQYIDADVALDDTRTVNSWIGQLTVTGVCRKGIGFVDPLNDDTGQSVNVKIDSLHARIGETIGLTTGYRMVHINPNKAGALMQTLVDVDHAQFITNTRNGSVAAPCVYTGPDTDVRFGKIDFPYHGSGTLIEANGRIRFYATANQVNNFFLPAFSNNPMFKITGTTGTYATADGSVVEVVCDSTANQMQQQILLLTNTVNCRVSIKARNYRNRNLVEFAGTNSGLYFHDSEIIGLGGFETGLLFGGTLEDCLFIGNRVAACGHGAQQNGTPAFSNCNGLANRMYSNGTNSNLAPGSIVDRGGSSTLSS